MPWEPSTRCNRHDAAPRVGRKRESLEQGFGIDLAEGKAAGPVLPPISTTASRPNGGEVGHNGNSKTVTGRAVKPLDAAQFSPHREGMSAPSTILVVIDADACPVKDEAYKVAGRHGVKTIVVSNSYMQLPRDPLIERVVVGSGLDVADDYIAERARRGIVVITADIPLAARCIKAGADVIAPNGRAHTEQSIGMVLATRNLMDDLRSAGQITGGPRAFAKQDRSNFLSALDLAIVRLKRAGLKPEA